MDIRIIHKLIRIDKAHMTITVRGLSLFFEVSLDDPVHNSSHQFVLKINIKINTVIKISNSSTTHIQASSKKLELEIDY